MATLDQIRDALAKIRHAKRDLDPNGDPLDDPRSDEDDDEDGTEGYYPDDEEDEKDDEDDFSRKPASRGQLALRGIPRIPSTVMPLQRLEEEAEQKAYQNCMRLAAKQIAAAKPTPRPLTKAEQDGAKIWELRMKTAQAESELRTKRQLEAQSERLEKVSLELYRANMTDKERREKDATMNTIATWASGICPEASPNWREEARLEFASKKL